MVNKITPEQYQQLWDTAEINPVRKKEVFVVFGDINKNYERYRKVTQLTGVPVDVIAVIHYRESSLDFHRQLHNGDPLTARTTHVPAGRPLKGNPPFTWEESAVDALNLRGLNKIKGWTIPEILKQLEGYNGLGYQRSTIQMNTPYLWAATNHYVNGKFVADGKFDATIKDKQLGCVPILKQLLSI